MAIVTDRRRSRRARLVASRLVIVAAIAVGALLGACGSDTPPSGALPPGAKAEDGSQVGEGREELSMAAGNERAEEDLDWEESDSPGLEQDALRAQKKPKDRYQPTAEKRSRFLGRQEPEHSGVTPAEETTMPSPTATVAPSPTATATPSPTATTAPSPTATAAPTQAPAPAKPGVVLDFDRWATWRRGDQPYGSLTQSSEQVKEDRFSAKLAYDFPATTDNFVVFLRTPPAPIPGQPKALTLWVYGDGANHFLNVWVRDSAGEVRQFTFGQLKPANANAWQRMTVALDPTAGWPQGSISGTDNGQLDYPISLLALVLDAVGDQESSGAIYLDELAVTR